jgi:hypothetical protein
MPDADARLLADIDVKARRAIAARFQRTRIS